MQSIENYSPGQTDFQFSLCETKISCEIKIGNFRRYETAILVIFEVLNFDFLENIKHLKVIQIPKFSLSDNQILREIKWDNFSR